MLFVSLFDYLSVFLCQLHYTSIFESRLLITPLLSPNLFTRYQVCTICLNKEDELCLNNSEYITIYMHYTNKYMCKLNFYKCWNICVDHCHLLSTVYKVKIEIKQMRLNLSTLHIYSRSRTEVQHDYLHDSRTWG